jgi:predicted aldo/keto reductase-like oxidoreductase
MQYRTIGKTDEKVSILGFGCMRLPMVGSRDPLDILNPDSKIDEDAAGKMIDRALQLGINYFDTAYRYHNGQSEPFLGKALEGVRDEVMIATKLPPWACEKPSDFDRILNEQLKNLRTDYIDFYLLHGLNQTAWEKMKSLDVLSVLDKILEDGRARYIGFSFHDNVKVFKEIVDSYSWSMCQIQYNYYDENYQAGREGLNYAAKKGMGIVVMEPLRGGRLTNNLPPEIKDIWD